MIKIIQATTDDQLNHVRSLKRAQVLWQKQTYHDMPDRVDTYFDPQKFEEELASLPGKFAPPSGRLLLAYCNGVAAGTVALCDFGNQICEMKAMFVYTHFQGKGIGRALAEALIEHAQTIGYVKMRLDTSPRQLAALGLYRSLGFQEIDPYHELPIELIFMELSL